jgi:hypothetical protein
MGEFDALWIADDEQIAEFAAALTSSPSVDVAFFPAAGHAIDFHRVGAAFQTQQLAFALRCAATAHQDRQVTHTPAIADAFARAEAGSMPGSATSTDRC